MAVLRLSNYVSASLAPGFLSNDSDRRVMTSQEGRRAIGRPSPGPSWSISLRILKFRQFPKAGHFQQACLEGSLS